MPLPLAATLIPLGVSAIGSVLGLMQSGKDKEDSLRLDAEARKKRPPLVDPNEQQYLNELERKKRLLSTGQDVAQQTAYGEIGEQQALANLGITRASGGAGGAAIAGMAMVQRGAGRATKGVFLEGQKVMLPYQQMEGAMVTRIASRKAELQLNESKTLELQSAELLKASREGRNAAIAGLIGAAGQAATGLIGEGKPKVIPPTGTTTPAVTPTPLPPNMTGMPENPLDRQAWIESKRDYTRRYGQGIYQDEEEESYFLPRRIPME